MCVRKKSFAFFLPRLLFCFCSLSWWWMSVVLCTYTMWASERVDECECMCVCHWLPQLNANWNSRVSLYNFEGVGKRTVSINYFHMAFTSSPRHTYSCITDEKYRRRRKRERKTPFFHTPTREKLKKTWKAPPHTIRLDFSRHFEFLDVVRSLFFFLIPRPCRCRVFSLLFTRHKYICEARRPLFVMCSCVSGFFPFRGSINLWTILTFITLNKHEIRIQCGYAYEQWLSSKRQFWIGVGHSYDQTSTATAAAVATVAVTTVNGDEIMKNVLIHIFVGFFFPTFIASW